MHAVEVVQAVKFQEKLHTDHPQSHLIDYWYGV